jgi:hypothetical protein
LFAHTLDTISKNWYMELEVRRETTNWEEFTHNFKVTFSFEDDAPLIDSTLQVIKNNIFSEKDLIELVPICSTHIYFATVKEVLHCYNVVEEYQGEEKDTRNVKIPKMEGEHIVEGTNLELVIYANPMRMHKLNIGTEDNIKFTNIGNHWNGETVEKIIDLLCEYQDLFTTTFLEMKGIVGDLG